MAPPTRTERVKQVYDNLLKSLWFQWGGILYFCTLTVLILYAGIQVHNHSKSLDRVGDKFTFVSGIDIEANQTNACKRCVSNDVIVNPGIHMEVDQNTTQFTGGIKTPCYTSGTSDLDVTQPTRVQINGSFPITTAPMLGNLSVTVANGLNIPSYVQNCTNLANPSVCLPMDTTFCDESNSPGSIYIHRRINMGASNTTTLTHYCNCILDTDATPMSVPKSALFCTEPLATLV